MVLLLLLDLPMYSKLHKQDGVGVYSINLQKAQDIDSLARSTVSNKKITISMIAFY